MTTGTAQPLTQDQARRLQAAHGELQRGRTREAADAVRGVCAENPNAPEALHLLALCLKKAGDAAGADRAFRTACTLAPANPAILGDYASLLRRIGRAGEAVTLQRRVTGLLPNDSRARMNLGLALSAAGRRSEAIDALESAIRLQPSYSEAWQALGSVRRAERDLEGAAAAFRRAVEARPGNGAAWVNLGVVSRMLGNPAESLACYDAARKAGFSGPELADARASALLDLGEAVRALEMVRRLTKKAPAYVAGHVLLAHILWEHGPTLAQDEDPLAAFRAAADAQPANLPLQFALVRFLINARKGEEALHRIRAMRREADHPMLAAMEANALDGLGCPAEAAALYEFAHEAMKGDADFLNAWTRHLLITGRSDAAAARAQEAVGLAPDDQEALAYLAVAWRILGDPREHWLCDYERLIGFVPVEPPPGYGDMDEFLSVLKDTLQPMHKSARAPVDQSLREGSQTSGGLFGRPDPVIAATREAIARAVERYIASLPDDPKHPYLGRKERSVRFVGSWSVKLWMSGRHANHIHREGWMSSAFYVSLPPSVSGPDDGARTGWIQFGQPPVAYGLGLEPRRFIRPVEGCCALFPSYMWHGTVPFDDDATRLTIAFDAQPKG